MELTRRLLPVALAVGLTGCSALGATTPQPISRPDDFALTYEWVEGSLPPPYHYEYVIRLTASGQGEVIMTPDYPADDVPVWTETFSLPADQFDQLYATMAAEGLLTQAWQAQGDPPVGGSSEWLTVTAAGRLIEIPAFVVPAQASRAEAIYAALRSAVPETIWSKLEAQRQEYVEAHPDG